MTVSEFLRSFQITLYTELLYYSLQMMLCHRPKQGIHRHLTPPRYRNASPYGPLRPNVTSSTIQSEIHNISQRRQRRTEPRPQGTRTQNFVKIGPVVPEICLRTDRQTDRQTDRNTQLPYRGRVTKRCLRSFILITPRYIEIIRVSPK